MKLDALAKQYFPAIIACLIAMVAYFQASGIGHLLGDTIAPEGPVPGGAAAAAAAKGARGRAPADADHTTSASEILARNPFDSVTGPLDGSNAPPPSDETPAGPPEDVDPYDAPACDSGRVVMIMSSEDPDWSFAAFDSGKGATVMRRRGAEINGKTVEHIGWDRVWLTSGSSRCQLQMGSKTAAAPSPTPSEPSAAAPTTSKARGRGALPQEIAQRIQRVGETEFNVDRSAVDMIIEQQATLMRSARITPEKRDGQVIGFKLARVQGGSLLDTLGLKNGDVLKSINGFEMSDPQKALEAYARLRAADRLSVAVERGGKPMNLDINIR